MLITKRRPKLKLENVLRRKTISTDFSENYTKHPSTIALPWQQWISYGTVCIQIESLLKAYLVKVRKFQLPTAYSFSSAEGRTSLRADCPPPDLFRVNK